MAASKKPVATDGRGRYRDLHRLGVGGMATVTLAEDTLLGRPVALKRVHAGGDQRAASRLRREALVGASLSPRTWSRSTTSRSARTATW